MVQNATQPNENGDRLKISLVIPAYNEEKAIKPVVEEYAPYVDEIIIVDDGSTDSSFTIAKTLQDEKTHVFRHEKNQGKVAALRTGVEHTTGDVVIFTDADCTYPARYIPEFVRKIECGYDLILGSRIINRENIPLFNRLGNFIFSSLAAYISGKTIVDSQTGFRAFRREMFERFDVEAKSLEFETKMTVRAAKLGYKIIEIPIEYRERVGTSKLHPIRDGFKMFFGLLAIAWNDTSPLGKMIMFPSFIFIIIGLGFGSVALYERLTVYHLVNEYYPLISVFAILLAIQLISIGLIVDFLTKKLDRIEEKLS
ncbi:glycosyltransferase family 2 protein [Methanoregula sp.]|uniref:glycosyltransferase family 2 protein n=1 Tax=Methanoregula sp. TaxID=2052170 RepID=UPI00236C4F2A|nr:glycosyltransferase family 2 protein [Methanoregula sp.]MDD1687204.1 glycosyltransferase family 2 protein [Methanoregula sp.]